MIFLAGLVLDQVRFEQSKPVQICPVSIPEPAMMGLGKKWGLLLRIRDDHHDIGSSRSRGDRAIPIEAKIGVSESGADLVRGAIAAEDRLPKSYSKTLPVQYRANTPLEKMWWPSLTR